ncbi:MAG TPA: alpha/beta fold hydrolase [Gemmatimonadales bacterium]|jgi:proline iminopeptidase
MAELLRDLGGVRLFERRAGQGPEVTVLHGGPGAHHDYLLPGFDLLARGRTLVYYDQRGGGRSPVAREVPVGWRQHVADLEALRRLWGLEQLVLAGYSWGGLLALLYALEHPGRVSRLALVSPAPCWRAARQEFDQRFLARSEAPAIRAMRVELAAGGLREKDPPAYRRRAFELSVAGYFHDPGRARELTPFRITGRTQREVWDSLGDFDLRDRLGSIGVPALVLHGDDDPIPLAASRSLAEGLDARLEVLPQCGHVPYVEAPDRFVALLDPFLPRQ